MRKTSPHLAVCLRGGSAPQGRLGGARFTRVVVPRKCRVSRALPIYIILYAPPKERKRRPKNIARVVPARLGSGYVWSAGPYTWENAYNIHTLYTSYIYGTRDSVTTFLDKLFGMFRYRRRRRSTKLPSSKNQNGE